MKFGVIGVGNMGGAILRGALSSAALAQHSISAFDKYAPSLDALKASGLNVTIAESLDDLAKKSDVILIAVKPHQVKTLFSELGDSIQDKAVISIAAGLTTQKLKMMSKGKARILRVMPNTPALVGEGATIFSNANDFTANELDFSKKLFAEIGRVYDLDESLINSATAVSGSGPAYAYLFVEALADGGVREGLPRHLAQELAAQTLMGAAKMILQTDVHPGKLKDNVCSPGGATIEAIAVLERNAFRSSLIEAATACRQKCEQLAEQDQD